MVPLVGVKLHFYESGIIFLVLLIVVINEIFFYSYELV